MLASHAVAQYVDHVNKYMKAVGASEIVRGRGTGSYLGLGWDEH